jgi:hypothetical protein
MFRVRVLKEVYFMFRVRFCVSFCISSFVYLFVVYQI